MKIGPSVIACLLLAHSASGGVDPQGTYSAHPPPLDPPTETAKAFFPPDDQCWNLHNKFDHPREIVSPSFRYDFYPKARLETTVLVEVNEYGYPTRLAVVSSNSERVANMMLAVLQKARWWVEPNVYGKMEVWFLYKFFSDGESWHIAK